MFYLFKNNMLMLVRVERKTGSTVSCNFSKKQFFNINQEPYKHSQTLDLVKNRHSDKNVLRYKSFNKALFVVMKKMLPCKLNNEGVAK